jgi:hypothetical protein
MVNLVSFGAGTGAQERQNLFTLSQFGYFVLDALGDLTILALQLAQFKEFTRGFWWIEGYVTANRFNIFLDILKLLGEENFERFLDVCAHVL